MEERLDRWLFKLQQYSFDIKHRKGILNKADVLSRQKICAMYRPLNVDDIYTWCKNEAKRFTGLLVKNDQL